MAAKTRLLTTRTKRPIKSGVRTKNRSSVQRAGHRDVCLVSMPFKDLLLPPIQLGLLQGCLEHAGITVWSYSLEIAFMEYLWAANQSEEDHEISIEDYQEVAHRDFVVHLGEWIFKVPPYADPSPRDDDYLKYVRESDTPEKGLTTAVRMRSLVPGFLEAAANKLLAHTPRVVGFSTVFQQNVPSLVLAKILKAKDPSLTIIFGGDNCDGPMGAALHECFPWIDVVVRGEGERVLVEVVSDVLAGRAVRPQPGLCYRIEGQSVAISQDSSPQLPMSEVPSPVYDDFFDQVTQSPLRNEILPEVAILFESSRGCWWGAKSHCTFCGLNAATMKFRSKPASRVAREIKELAERYKILKFVAVDDIIDLEHVRDLLPLLKDVGDLEIFYETKANLKKEHIRAFQNAGVVDIQPGIESLSTPILRLMRKGVTALQNIRLLKWSAEIGIKPSWNLLYGFPGEPPEEYERMAELIPSLVHLEVPAFCHVQVQRFSPYYERAAQYGLELTGPMPYYEFLYSVAPDKLINLAYDFGHRYDDGRDPETYTKPARAAVKKWREVTGEGLGSLYYRRGPGFLTVHDHRPGLDPANYQFDGAEAKIYLACDAGASPSELRLHLAEEGEVLEEDEITGFLEEVVAARLMYREDNRYLALAIGPSETGKRAIRPRVEGVAAA